MLSELCRHDQNVAHLHYNKLILRIFQLRNNETSIILSDQGSLIFNITLHPVDLFNTFCLDYFHCVVGVDYFRQVRFHFPFAVVPE